jgi:hypothetical protein
MDSSMKNKEFGSILITDFTIPPTPVPSPKKRKERKP